MNCKSAQPLLEAFVDGELGAEQTLEIQAHVDLCPACAEQREFAEALKNSIKRMVSTESEVSEAFRNRLVQAMARERAASLEREAQASKLADVTPVIELAAVQRATATPFAGFLWRNVLPFAAAAAVFAFWFKTQNTPQGNLNAAKTPAVVEASAVDTPLSPAALMEQTLDRLIDYHSSPPAPQVMEEDLVSTFESDVGVRVHAPSLSKFGALWEGASIVPVRNHQAAYMRYRLPDSHVTVYVFDPRKVSVQPHLVKKIVRNHPVYVGHWRGYSVAAKENRGIGYAMASDLDDFEVEELITELH